jgi:putative PEP-CTERM system histidine kinase
MYNDSIGTISYIGGSILFGLFLICACVSAIRKQTSWWLSLPAAISTSTLALMVVGIHSPGSWIGYLPILELLRNGSWYVAIMAILRGASESRIPGRYYWVILGCWGLLLLFNLLIMPLGPETPLAANPVFIWNGLLLSIIGLVAVEQLYRNTQQERQTKLISVSVGALFLYDLYLFAHALAFRYIDPDLWLARGAVQGASALLMALGVTAFTKDSERLITLSLSRPIAFYTTSLTIAGFFIMLMAAGSYYIRHWGGSWGNLLQVLLIFSACITLASVFVSRRLRIRLNVFIEKHFFSNKYDYRTEWLKLINSLSQSTETVVFHERAILAMASIFRSPGGCIWLHNQQQIYEPVAAVNFKLPPKRTIKEPADSSFCHVLREQGWVFSPGSPDGDQTSHLNELLPDWIQLLPDLWIIVPLLNEDELTGFIGLAMPAIKPELNWEDLDLLKTVGRQISSYVTRHQAAELLVESHQFDAYNKLTAFVMHDLKNLIAQQALVIKNAAKHRDNPAFIDDMINTVENSVNRMNSLLQKLQRKEAPVPTATGWVDLEPILVDAITKCRDRYPLPSLHLKNHKLRVQADPEHLEMVLQHIIRNAQEATIRDGYVDVTLISEKDEAIIEIEDNGTGMDASFVATRLFKPFDTTKSGKGMGVGVYQAREFLRSIGGEIDVESEPGKGSLFRLRIPARKI